MVGYPKWINTKDDLLTVIRDFPNDSRTKAFLESLLADRFGWFTCAECADDATHKKVTDNMMGEETISYYELRENPTARIFQMGLTVAEVEDWSEV